MKINILANRYAVALLNIVGKNNYAEIAKQAAILGEIYSSNAKLKLIFNDPQIAKKVKYQAFDKIFGSLNLNNSFVNCLKLMIAKSRFMLLDDFIKEIAAIAQKQAGQKTAYVISAKKIDDDLKNKILNKLNSKGKVKYLLDLKSDPNILGGIILRIDDMEYDYSIRGQLAKLTEKIEIGLQQKYVTN